MQCAPLPENESERLLTLQRYQILDTPPDPDLDSLVHLAATLCEVPISLVSLSDTRRQWFKAKIGLAASEVPRDLAFCGHALTSPEALIIPDTLADQRFEDNPLVQADPHIRFYAGMPLESPEGHRLGTLCVMDRQPRTLTTLQQTALLALSKQVMRVIEQHRQIIQLQDMHLINGRLIALLGERLKEPMNNTDVLLRLLDAPSGLTPALRQACLALQQDIGVARQALDNFEAWLQLQRNKPLSLSQPLHLTDVIQAVIRRLQEWAASKGNQVSHTVPEGLIVSLPMAELRFVLHSLLHNALKYTEQGQVSLSLTQTPDTLMVSLEDTGPGVPADVLKLLGVSVLETLAPGTQGEQGLGLGLLLSQYYVRHFGGQLHFANTATGFRVNLHLPRHVG
ncbi:MAG: ATP-binding protein [Candidatus Sericytochromatia bacterium]